MITLCRLIHPAYFIILTFFISTVAVGDTDSDDDGMADNWELQYGLDPSDPTDAVDDLDSDTLINLREYSLGTNPLQPDTDGDKLKDGFEINFDLNPLVADPVHIDADGDGLSLLDEAANNTDPNQADSDADGLSDGDEKIYNGFILNCDTDNDTMHDGWEVTYSLDLTDERDAKTDLDQDLLINKDEFLWNTNPTLKDTDGDGLEDGIEVSWDLNPTTSDSNSNGIPDPFEGQLSLGVSRDLDGNQSKELIIFYYDKLRGNYYSVLMDAVTGERINDVVFDWGQPLLKNSLFDPNKGLLQTVLQRVPGKWLRAETKNLQTTELVSQIAFDPTFEAKQLLILKDTDSNGFDELLLLALNAEGVVRAIVRDLAEGSFLRLLQFEDLQYPISSRLLNAPLEGGAKQMAVLGVGEEGDYLLQKKDTLTTQKVGSTIAFNPTYEPRMVVVMEDVNGNGAQEFGVLGISTINGSIKAEVLDSDNGELINRIPFDSKFIPIGFKRVSDLNGNGWPELAVMGVNSQGRGRLQIKDLSTKADVRNIFFGDKYLAVDFAVINNIDKQGTVAVAVLGVNLEGKIQVQIKDIVTGMIISYFFL